MGERSERYGSSFFISESCCEVVFSPIEISQIRLNAKGLLLDRRTAKIEVFINLKSCPVLGLAMRLPRRSARVRPKWNAAAFQTSKNSKIPLST
jgi:hypothetical protein